MGWGACVTSIGGLPLSMAHIYRPTHACHRLPPFLSFLLLVFFPNSGRHPPRDVPLPPTSIPFFLEGTFFVVGRTNGEGRTCIVSTILEVVKKNKVERDREKF